MRIIESGTPHNRNIFRDFNRSLRSSDGIPPMFMATNVTSFPLNCNK